MIYGKDHDEIVAIQEKVIKDCKADREEWEKLALIVELSYKNKKNPYKVNGTNKYVDDPNKKPVVNLLKRQHKAIMSYMLNNEPTITVRGKNDVSRQDQANSKILLDRDFKEGDFQEEDLDMIIDYGYKRGIVYILSIFQKDDNLGGKVKHIIEDSMDTYISTNVGKKKDIEVFINTFLKTKDRCKTEYKTYPLKEGETEAREIDWDNMRSDMESTLSDKKKLVSLPITIGGSFLFRQGFYLCYNEELERATVMRALTLAGKLIAVEEYESLDFLSVDYFAPSIDHSTLYNTSYYEEVLTPEEEVNNILRKFINIVNTGGRYVYVREGTRISKGVNSTLQGIGLEILEIGEAQELPKSADPLTISQSQMAFLNLMIDQAEQAGGMRQEIMGGATGSDASGNRIDSLIAGSKNNMGMGLSELNKFMGRLANSHFKLYSKMSGKIKIYDDDTESHIKVDIKKLGKPKIKIEGKSAFDDISQKADSIQLLEYIMKFDPETKISYETIIEIFKGQNELAKMIDADIKAQEDPDLVHAESCTRLLMMGKKPAVSETDDHTKHIAMLTKLLADGKQLPEEIQQNIIVKIKTHEALAGGNPAERGA